jgi:hypothetical protein
MKKILQLTLIAVIATTLMSCEKEEQKPSKEINNEISDSQAQNDGKFKKEIIVTDASGNNQAFYAIYSDEEQLLNDYLEANHLSLKVNEDDVEILKKTDLASDQSLKSTTSKNFDLTEEPKIIVELVTTNLQENVVSYSLKVERIQLKSTNDFIYGYPVGYVTKNDFIGAVHRGWGYEFAAKLRYKSKWWKSWKYLEVNGANAWFIYPSGTYYIALDEDYDLYKRGIVIYPHLYQNGTNYTIAYNRNGFRGRDCTIGNYDGANCLVGTPPSGTSAFIYRNRFYYTPVSGNQCPRPGSRFDGANCLVMSIPSNCDPFIWSNRWYVKTDKISY